MMQLSYNGHQKNIIKKKKGCKSKKKFHAWIYEFRRHTEVQLWREHEHLPSKC